MTTYTVIRPYRRPDGKLLNHHGRVRVHKVVLPKLTKTGYGALYNWYAVEESANQGGFVTGFHVPSDAEWYVLTDYIQAEIDATVLENIGIGCHLKSARTEVGDPLVGTSTNVHPRWDYHETNYGRDTVNFCGIPGGYRHGIDGDFRLIGFIAYFWSTDEQSGSEVNIHIKWLSSNNTNLNSGLNVKSGGLSIRLVRNATSEEQTLADGTIINTVQDFNGNYYQVVKIGTQAWLAQNIRCTNYADGTAIPNVTGDANWAALTTHAYCWYNNDINTDGIVYTDEFIEL